MDTSSAPDNVNQQDEATKVASSDLSEFDPELYDQIHQLAFQPEETTFARLAERYHGAAIRSALDQAAGSLSQQLFRICGSLIASEPSSPEPDHLAFIMQHLFGSQANQEFSRKREEAFPIIRALSWVHLKRIELGVPRLIKRLQRLAETAVGAHATYDEIEVRRSLAETMLRALPNVTLPNVTFFHNIQTNFGLTPDPSDANLVFYKNQVAQTLYYHIVMYDLFLAYQSLHNQPNEAEINAAAFDLAPDIVKMLAISRDRKLAMLSIAAASQQLTEPTSLDIA